jgi:hypothetical protein
MRRVCRLRANDCTGIKQITLTLQPPTRCLLHAAPFNTIVAAIVATQNRSIAHRLPFFGVRRMSKEEALMTSEAAPRLYRVRKTVFEMLVDRGADTALSSPSFADFATVYRVVNGGGAGYRVAQDDLKMTLEEFKKQFEDKSCDRLTHTLPYRSVCPPSDMARRTHACVWCSRAELRITVAKRDDPTEKDTIFVFFSEDSNLGVKPIRE